MPEVHTFTTVDRFTCSIPVLNSPRFGQPLQVALGAAAALAAVSLTTGSAQAIVVTVNSVPYEVTTFTGTYNDNIGKFATAANGGVMPWFGNSSLAEAFAAAVGQALLFPNFNGVSGPLFPFEVTPLPSVLIWTSTPFTPTPIAAGVNVNISRTWAQATEVPGPLPALGAAAAFGFSRKLRKRIKGGKNTVSSTYSL
jgi:hypothetical protein